MDVDVDFVLGKAREFEGRGHEVTFCVLMQVHSATRVNTEARVSQCDRLPRLEQVRRGVFDGGNGPGTGPSELVEEVVELEEWRVEAAQRHVGKSCV